MRRARSPFLWTSLLIAAVAPSVACSASGEDAESQGLELVTSIQCSVVGAHAQRLDRGSFVSRSSATADGEITISCPSGNRFAFNQDPVTTTGNATTFTVKPHEGVNVVHVEKDEATGTEATDLAFLFGTFNSNERAMSPKAVALHVGAKGLSRGGQLVLPLPAGPTPVDVSQITTQVVRDQGNILARFNGTTKDFRAVGFRGLVTVEESTYDYSQFELVITPRAGGLHVDAKLYGVSTSLLWDASLIGLEAHDRIEASIDQLHVAADLDLSYDASGKAIKATLGAHDTHVDGVDFDSQALSRIPFGIGNALERAISGAAHAIINTFGDSMLDLVKDSVIPKIELSLDQLKLPTHIESPLLGGGVDIGQSIGGAKFDATGVELSLDAGVFPSAQVPSGQAPGWLTRPTKAATFDPTASFGASLSLDYVNQALYAAWRGGLMNRKVSGPVSQFGISVGDIYADAKLPPVILPAASGSGTTPFVHVGELELTTVFHSTSAGDATVKIGVSLVATAKIELADQGKTVLVQPSGDEANTRVYAEVTRVTAGKQEAADELKGILSLFLPYIQTVVATDLQVPPIAVPGVDLGLVTPGFRGRTAHFDGALRFDPGASRIGIEGRLLAD